MGGLAGGGYPIYFIIKLGNFKTHPLIKEVLVNMYVKKMSNKGGRNEDKEQLSIELI